MTVVDDLTPAQYSLGTGKMIVARETLKVKARNFSGIARTGGWLFWYRTP